MQYITNAISLGSFYALLTVGIALMFGLMGLMNFAYGEIVGVAAFALVFLKDYPWLIAVLVALVFGVATSVFTEFLVFRPLRRADGMTLMIASFAVGSALQNIGRMTVLPRAKGVPSQGFMARSVTVFGAQVSMLTIFTLALCLVLLGLLYLLMQRTSLGMQLRAASESAEMARVVGVRHSRIIPLAFGVVGVIAAASAVILVARQGAVSAEMGLQPLLIGVVGAVLGGMQELKGAVLGGFLLGVFTVTFDQFLPLGMIPFRDALLYTLVIGVLVFRPQGILPGRKVRLS